MKQTNLKVQKAEAHEVFKGIVRVHEQYRTTKNGAICWVTVDKRTRPVLASVRGMKSSDPLISMDEDLRERLDVKIDSTYPFTFKAAKLWGQICWHWSTSDPAVRIPARLGVISFVLGWLSLAIALCK